MGPDRQPACDNVSSTGACLDEGTPDEPQPTPTPEPEPAGAGGIDPPVKNCLDDASRDALIESMPLQWHHMVTNKHRTWTPAFEKRSRTVWRVERLVEPA